MFHLISELFHIRIIKNIKYRKVPKFSDTKNFAVRYLKFKQSGQTLGYFVRIVKGIANSEDPDQTAPLGAV